MEEGVAGTRGIEIKRVGLSGIPDGNLSRHSATAPPSFQYHFTRSLETAAVMQAPAYKGCGVVRHGAQSTQAFTFPPHALTPDAKVSKTMTKTALTSGVWKNPHQSVIAAVFGIGPIPLGIQFCSTRFISAYNTSAAIQYRQQPPALAGGLS